MFSPDPPSPDDLVTEPLTGTLRLIARPERHAAWDVTDFHLRTSSSSFAIDGIDEEPGYLVGGLGLGVRVDLRINVLINGEPVLLPGRGIYTMQHEAPGTLSDLEICAPFVEPDCEGIRTGRRAGYFLRIDAVPQE